MNALMCMHELVLEGQTGGLQRTIVDRLSISIAPGESLALVGESGSGKSLTALALMGLLPEPSVTVGGGSIRFQEADLLAMAPRERRRITGREIAMVFQEPMTSLNPVMRAGDQIVEMIRAHEKIGRRAARARAAELLAGDAAEDDLHRGYDLGPGVVRGRLQNLHPFDGADTLHEIGFEIAGDEQLHGGSSSRPVD